MSEARKDARDLKDDGHKSANSDARNYAARGSLADQRTSGRTLGCVGFSTILHTGLLLALALAPLAIREAGGDNAGSHDGGVAMVDSKPAPGEAPMSVELSDASAAKSAAATATSAAVSDANGSQAGTVSVLTDETSNIEMPANNQPVKKTDVAAVMPLPEKAARKVEIKPVAKIAMKPAVKVKPVVAAKAVAESKALETKAVEAESAVVEEAQNEPAPVLLANPPSDDEVVPEKEAALEKEVAQEKIETPPPVAEVKKEKTPEEKKPTVVQKIAAAIPIEKKAEKPVEKPVAVVVNKVEAAPIEEKEESPSKFSSVAPVQSKSQSENSESRGSGGNAAKENDSDDAGATGGTSAAAMSSGSGQDQNQDANGKEGDGTSAGAIAGPIRDASELKALPGNPNPVYPARDRLAHKEGTAVVLGRVSADGRVTEVSVERSSGSANMDSASLQAFRSWRFQGGQQGWVRKPFQFRLVGDAKEVPAPLGKSLQR